MPSVASTHVHTFSNRLQISSIHDFYSNLLSKKLDRQCSKKVLYFRCVARVFTSCCHSMQFCCKLKVSYKCIKIYSSIVSMKLQIR